MFIRELSLDDALRIRDTQRPDVGWATDFPTDEDVRVANYAKFIPSSTSEPWYAPWLIAENELVVGMLGFKSEPVANALEVGYGVVPSARGRGVATAALSLLLERVTHRGLIVRAETALWNVPSQLILRRLNFNEVRRRNDPQHGDLIVWELSVD
ncbi:MAG TPA: GNAT family N-acetyltransferase [Acidimicrobiales bacterium]